MNVFLIIIGSLMFVVGAFQAIESSNEAYDYNKTGGWKMFIGLILVIMGILIH